MCGINIILSDIPELLVLRVARAMIQKCQTGRQHQSNSARSVIAAGALPLRSLVLPLSKVLLRSLFRRLLQAESALVCHVMKQWLLFREPALQMSWRGSGFSRGPV